jgi:hypothetical protein
VNTRNDRTLQLRGIVSNAGQNHENQSAATFVGHRQ